MKKSLSLVPIGLVLAACGGDPVDRAPPGKSEISVQHGAGTIATFTTTEALTAGGAVERLGVSAEGHLIAVIDGGLYELEGGLLAARTLYAGEGDPEATGPVHAVAPRVGGGAWVGAERGLFAIDDLYTYKVPLLPEAGAVRAVADAPGGPLNGLWLATDEGLYRRQDEQVTRYTIEGVTGPATGVAITGNGKLGAALFGETLVVLEPNDAQVLTDRPPLGTSTIDAVAAGPDTIYVGADNGLLVLRTAADPAWTRHTLAEQGAAPPAVTALSVDTARDAVWARIERGLVRLEGGHLNAYEMGAEGAMSLLAVDNFGDVWTADGDALDRRSTGTAGAAATFAEDVLPWIQEHCSMCHMNQTQNFEDLDVFREVAEPALARVRSGDMPRCEGGLRCPNEQRLQQDDYAVLEQWIRAGMPE